MNNLGILVIDMQEDFIWASLPNEIESLIGIQKKLFAFAREKEIPIFVLEYCDSGKTIERLADELPKNKTYFIPKFANDAFVKEWSPDGKKTLKKAEPNNQFIETLKQEKIKNLILTGINKDTCVQSTMLGARSHNYATFTSEELMNHRVISIHSFYENSNHYETLSELLEAVSKN